MKKALLAILACILILAFSPFAFSAEEEDPEDLANWSSMAPVVIDTIPDSGLVEFPVTQQICDIAQSNLSDLRLMEMPGKTRVPFETRWPQIYKIKKTPTPFYAKLINMTYQPGRQTSVVADFVKPIVKNEITITTGGANFRRKVLIEGSDDAKKWEYVREGAFLFSVNADWLPKGHYLKDIVKIPANNQRYLRITVFNGEEDPAKIVIGKISFAHVESSIEPEGPDIITPTVIEKEEIEKEKATEITLDMGRKNLPFHEISMDFEQENFLRRVSVQGRNRETYKKIINTENGKIEKEFKQPWKTLTDDVIYRFSAGKKPDEKLYIKLRKASWRYIKIRIENRDDPPLTFVGANATWSARLIAFPAKKDHEYVLYFGNPKAMKLSYDFSYYSQRLREEGVTPAYLSAVTPNEKYVAEKPKEKPWHERYSYALWIVLIAAVAVMGFLIYRLASNPPKPD